MESADAGALPLREPRRGPVRAAVATMRPKQWIKNALVVAAAGAAGALGHDDVPARVALATAAFCLLASGIYAVNDVLDAPEDRHHPVKRHRPVAAGTLDPIAATALGLWLMLAGLILCAVIAPLLALVGAAYLGLTISYTLLWRHVLVLDIVAIAGGFVLRAVAGGVSAPVTLSRWFLLVVVCGAVFVAAAKRYAELRRAGRDRLARRRVLHSYSPRLPLDSLDAWPRLYGPSGLLQYQLVVPSGSEHVLEVVIERLRQAHAPCYLAVLKDLGPANGSPLSFPLEGWTLTLDLPRAAPGIGPLLDGFDRLVAEAGGAST